MQLLPTTSQPRHQLGQLIRGQQGWQKLFLLFLLCENLKIVKFSGLGTGSDHLCALEVGAHGCRLSWRHFWDF